MSINLDNLEIRIRKHTLKYHKRAKIRVYTKGYARIEITDVKWQNYNDMACILNHEFLHWIITLLTHIEPKKYDKYLEAFGLYQHEYLMEEMM